MTFPTSCTPARLAVENALTTATGKPRALASLFRLFPPAFVARNPADLKKRPAVYVLFRDAVLDGEMENGSSIAVLYTVKVYVDYYMGSDVTQSEAATQLAIIEADANRIRAALCYPGALALSPSGADTGLEGQALMSAGWMAQGPDPTPPTPESTDRVLRVVHTFRASINTLQPT